ncbi:MAG: hypothetical protein EHM22_04955, partial [Actinobacteria bacterium]
LVPAASIFAIVLLGACSSGDTEVEPGGTTPTGPTATGPTATGPTATAPTGPTSTGGAFDGPVSLDLSAKQNPTGASMYSCDGVEGTWTYEPGELPIQGIELTLDASEVDMSGGDGTLVISGEITIPGGGRCGFHGHGRAEHHRYRRRARDAVDRREGRGERSAPGRPDRPRAVLA